MQKRKGKFIDNIIEVYNKLPLVVQVIIAVILVSMLWRFLKKYFKPSEVPTDIADIPGAQLDRNECKQIAQDIFNALDGFTENEEAVYNAFRRIPDKQSCTMVAQAYGSRNTGMFGGTYDLWSALRRYFNSSELDKLRTICRDNGYEIPV